MPSAGFKDVPQFESVSRAELAARRAAGDLTDLAFGSKKAAPFVKGGGRKVTAKNDAKGRTRKVKVAKARAKKARMGSTVDNALGGAKWRHGWIPVNAAAREEKLKMGDTVRERLLKGIDNRRDFKRKGKVVGIGDHPVKGSSNVKVAWDDGKTTTHDSMFLEKKRKTGFTHDNSNERQAVRPKAADLAITPGGRVGDASPLGKPGSKRKLTDQEREIAHALIRKGKSKRDAIRMARGLVNHAAATGRWAGKGKASPAVKAAAVASVAQRASFSNGEPWSDADLTLSNMEAELTLDFADAKGGTWKHGYVPTNAIAVEEKEHKLAGGGRGKKISAAKSKAAGGRALVGSDHTKYLSDKTKVSAAGLRRHADTHEAAAKRARSDASKQKHLAEAASARAELAQRAKAKASAKREVRPSRTPKGRRQTKLTPSDRAVIDKIVNENEGHTKSDPTANAWQLTPKALVDALKNPKITPERKRALKIELAKRKTIVKSLLGEKKAAKDFVDKNEKLLEDKPHLFFRGLYKIAPHLKPHLEKIRKSKVGRKLKEKEYLQSVIDAVTENVIGHVLPVIIGSGAATLGLGLISKLFLKGGE